MADFQNYKMACLKDPEDDRDYLWRQKVSPQVIHVPDCHMITSLGPVRDQGTTSECVAYASASMKTHQEFVEHKKYYTFDPAWLYALCKEQDGIPDLDGTYIRVAMDIMQGLGFLAKAEKYKLKDDHYFKIENYVRLTSTQQVFEALYHVGPVIGGFMVDDSWFNTGPDGIIPEANGVTHGGHAVAICGYNKSKKCHDSTGAFLIKNSWGTDWGRKGYAWLPFSHLLAYPNHDMWRAVDAEDLL